MFLFICLLLSAYLLGSVSSSNIIAKAHDIDLKNVGSGNFGATNTLRALGWKLGLLTLLLDAFKGAILVIVSWNILSLPLWQVAIISLAVIIGHAYSVFLGFKGGKAIATGGGIFLVLNPLAAVIAILVFVIIYYFTKYVSLGSLYAATAILVSQGLKGRSCAWGDNLYITIFSVLVLVLVLYLHRSNIVKLWHNTENKTYLKTRSTEVN
ncbi:glycerol-3-phosphate 1-O-acyltransferase PlsY [Candidatus Falkowbacteria bacterium]|nr:glycerol-3-phosphate 1-O-acyltransferase PlsY [Candidatus Falkowbacteria bacterium]NCQ12883.1 glycerol-3-phosphate 1-O-acyltransferase PlsY [Candidatus Falkowbacteria bacterium]OIO06680.1 MAG: acyl-phosphate glycerol 3-phosphate acyltransferase [Candidatus Falkowbacteria bacterium CG1_02_37_21]